MPSQKLVPYVLMYLSCPLKAVERLCMEQNVAVCKWGLPRGRGRERERERERERRKFWCCECGVSVKVEPSWVDCHRTGLSRQLTLGLLWASAHLVWRHTVTVEIYSPGCARSCSVWYGRCTVWSVFSWDRGSTGQWGVLQLVFCSLKRGSALTRKWQPKI